MKQRIDLPAAGDCLLLERMQLALRQMEERREPPLDQLVAERLKPFRLLDPTGSLTCQDAGSSLNDACGTLLHALALAQDAADGPMSITAHSDQVLITVPGAVAIPLRSRVFATGSPGTTPIGRT
jgi:hypothetical protein